MVNSARAGAVRASSTTPKGGYRIIGNLQICMGWSAYKSGAIRYIDFRVYMALHEVVERRLVANRRRKLAGLPSRAFEFDLAKIELEVHALVGGVGGRHILAALRRIEQAGLVTILATGITFDSDPARMAPNAADGLREMLAGIDARPGVRTRAVPIPRTMIRHIAAGCSAAQAATMLGCAMRCLFRRTSGVTSEGSCAVSYIADLFGIHPRTIKRARAELVTLGWLRPRPADNWHVQAHGARVAINLGWTPGGTHAAELEAKARPASPATTGIDACPARIGSPPPAPRIVTKSPPPVTNKKLLPDENQKPADRGPNGACRQAHGGRAALEDVARTGVASGGVTPTAMAVTGVAPLTVSATGVAPLAGHVAGITPRTAPVAGAPVRKARVTLALTGTVNAIPTAPSSARLNRETQCRSVNRAHPGRSAPRGGDPANATTSRGALANACGTSTKAPLGTTANAPLGITAKAPLGHIAPGDLRDDRALERLFAEACHQRLLKPGEADRLRFFAAAERALRVGTRNPAGLFATIVRQGLWSHIAQVDEDLALARMKRKDAAAPSENAAAHRTHGPRQRGGTTVQRPVCRSPVDALIREVANMRTLDTATHRGRRRDSSPAGGGGGRGCTWLNGFVGCSECSTSSRARRSVGSCYQDCFERSTGSASRERLSVYQRPVCVFAGVFTVHSRIDAFREISARTTISVT